MNWVFYVVILFFLCGSCKREKKAEENFEQEYLQDFATHTARWGYITKDAEVAIPHQFSDCTDFVNGYAAVNVNGKWGVIDIHGNQVIQAEYLTADITPNQKLICQLFSAEFQIRDIKTNVQLGDNYKEVGVLQHGSFAIFDNAWAVIDNTGAIVLDPIYDEIKEQIDADHYIVRYLNKLGVISKHKQWLIEPNYTHLFAGNNFFAASSDGNRFLVLQKSDLTTIETIPTPITQVHQSIIVYSHSQQYMIKDVDTKKIMGPYDDVLYVGVNRFAVKKNDKWMLLNAQLTENHSLHFDVVSRFSESYAAVAIGEKWTFIDTMAKPLLPPEFDLVWDFKDGMARVMKNGELWYIGLDGQLKLKASHIDSHDFANGLARVPIE